LDFNILVVLVTASYDHTIRFWDVSSTACTVSIQYTDTQVNTLAISPSKEYLLAASNNTLRLYSIETQQLISSYEGHTGNIMSIGFQREEQWLFSGGEDKMIRIWDFKTCKIKKAIECKSSVNSVVLHPNQAELIVAEESGNLSIFDLSQDLFVYSKFPNGQIGIRSLSISLDGGIVVSANNKGEVCVWKKMECALDLIQTFSAHNDYILKCMISPNGKMIATCSSDYSVKLWTMKGELIKEMKEHKRWVWDCAFSSDSLYLVTCSSDCTTKLWDLQKGESIKTYKGHQKACVCLALNDHTKK
jgi:G protein beta subunit-like protein